MEYYKNIYRAKIKISEETILEAKADDKKYGDNNTDQWKAWDGIEVTLAESLGGFGFIILGWSKENDSKVKEAIYIIHQDRMFGSYVNERKIFDKDWGEDNMEGDACAYFQRRDFEILEVIEGEG